MGTSLTYDTLLERIIKWAEGRDDIRLAVVIGSRARVDRPADVWSDLDLLYFTTDPSQYLSDASWLTELGVYHITFLESTAVGGFVERRVLFDGGLDVDFIPLPMRVVQGDVPPEMSAVLRRGYQVLMDKDGLSRKLDSAVADTKECESSATRLPSNESFVHLVNDFLYHAVWSAKKLCRGELWTAKMCCDGYMKRQLLEAIEWHQRATTTTVDTWHEGRFLDSRIHPSILNELHDAFAIYEPASMWDALHTSIELFGRVCRELGQRLGYLYPNEGHEYVVGLLREYRLERSVAAPSMVQPFSPRDERVGLLHHVELNVSNLRASSRFWEWLLDYLGYAPHQTWAKGRSWRKGGAYLVLVQTEEQFLPSGYHRKGTGLNHIAFHAESRHQVDELTGLIRSKGIHILYEERHPYAGGSDHYAVFF